MSYLEFKYIIESYKSELLVVLIIFKYEQSIINIHMSHGVSIHACIMDD